MPVSRRGGFPLFVMAVLAALAVWCGSAWGEGPAVYEGAIGSYGSGAGDFNHPAGVAVGAEGEVWVVDQNNDRVQQFDASGEFVFQFGSSGSGPGEFGRPTDVAIDASGNVWVTDANNNRIEKFDPEGEFIASVGSYGSGTGHFSGPEGIAADSEGHIWVGDTYQGRVQEFNEAGEFIRVVGSHGSGEGQLGEPVALDIGPGGDVWVADWQFNRVAVFDSGGEFQFQFGSSGSGSGQFAHPDAIAVDPEGNAWVGDEGNDRVEQFNESGEYVGTIGSSGSGSGQFQFGYPFGVATDTSSHLYVADSNNNRLQRWGVVSLPSCISGEASTEVNEALELGPGALECEGEGTLEYEIVSGPKHGELTSFDSATGAITYEPDFEFLGRDSFKFAASNSAGQSAAKTFFVQVGEFPPGAGTVAAYSFNEGEGETAHDSANEHDGKLHNGATWVQGKFGSAVNLVAENAGYVYVPFSSDFSLTEEFTAEAWVRPRILSSYAPVLTKARGPYEWDYILRAGGDEWGVPDARVSQSGGNPNLGVSGGGELPPETWTHLAMTYNGELLRLYVDGELVGSKSSPPPGEKEGSLNIGLGPSTASSFDGKIDEVRLYERALSGVEIEKDMETPIEGTEGSENPEEPEEPEACEAPQVKMSGPAVNPAVPGVELEIHAGLGETPCAGNGEQSRVSRVEVSVDEELVFSEDRSCERPPDPCSRSFYRRIQLPWEKVVGTHSIRVDAEDQLGNKAEPAESAETTEAEGTISKVPADAEDEPGSPGCEKPKNRFHHYVFKGHVVHGTVCADIMGAYPQYGTTVYVSGGGDDVIKAGGEIDKIVTGAGNDRIYAGRGNDLVYAGNGADQIVGGSGDDELYGQQGDDLLFGTSGADKLLGGPGSDMLDGGGTADSLFGGNDGEPDTISFGDAVTPGFEFGEFLTGFPATSEGRGVYLDLEEEPRVDKNHDEYVRAFDGSTARFGGGVDKVYVSDGGFQTIVGTPFADRINGSAAAETIDGGGGQDIISGAGGNDTLFGGAESDSLDGGADQAPGSLNGGDGHDICLNRGGEAPGCESENTEEGLEAPTGAIAIGTLDPEGPQGGTGIFVRGSAGRDQIAASWNEKEGRVDFTAAGDSGFDAALNSVDGCTIEGVEEGVGSVAHCPAEALHTLVIDGRANNDVLTARNFPPAVSVTLLGGPGRDVLHGGISEDILVDGPGNGNDDLYGKKDDDTLFSNDGRDRAYGEEGSDLFVSGEVCEGDVIRGGTDKKTGADIDNASWAQLRGAAKGESGEFEEPVNGVDVSVPQGSTGDIGRHGGSCEEKGTIKSVEFLEGSGGNDVLEGNNSHNVLLGRSGSDELIGLGGKDNLLANNRDPSSESEAKQKDIDEQVDCGLPDVGRVKDVAKVDPADLPNVEEDCEIVKSKAPPAQSSAAGIGADPTSEVPTMSLDESVIGGSGNPEAVSPDAFFRLDDNTGTVAENWSDEEASGSYEGGVELGQEGAIGESRGVHLDGENDYLDLTAGWDPHSFISPICEADSGYSVELWVKFDNEAEGREELFSRVAGADGVSLYRSADGQIRFSVSDSIEHPTVSSEAIDDSQWHHVVATMAQQGEPCEIISSFASVGGWELEEDPLMSLTVDGFSYNLELGRAGIIPAATPSAHNLVGARDSGSGPVDLLDGTVDDVAIYGEPLEEEEVQAHRLIGDAVEADVVLVPYVSPEAPDGDEDEVPDQVDNCPETANSDQEDSDGDGVGDACQTEPDSDEDGVPNETDNCPDDVNPLQEDEDENGVGDVCEPE